MLDDSPALHQALRKCFQVVQEQHEAWQSMLTAFMPLFSSLANLAEQMQSCQKVTFASTPLRDFPELAEQLKHKQRCAMGGDIPEPVFLPPGRAGLQRVRDTVSSSVGTVFQLYEQHADGLGLEASLQRSAVNPSLADMLEWLQDIESYYRHLYLESRLLLQIRYENLPEMQALPQAWERMLEHNRQDVVQGNLSAVLKWRSRN
uniref:AFG2 interacting ribosome maturation factor n=1 Tax=Sphenodon punctatus TaxID=8508 RepID=A0A8D0L323_SPHPU